MMRQLADYSFMLKDFRFAQSVYQVARRDFLAEKAWKCYAGAQEMVGLCKLMWEVQATKAEFDSNFDDAATTYLHKTHSPHPFLAIRSVILYYELLKHHRMLAYAPVALLRVPRVHVSLNALMSEQAAYSFLKFAPRPEVRKFSFYAMVASQQFQRAEMGELAHRCLRMVRHALATPSGLRSQRGADEDEKAGYEEEKKPGPGDAGGTRDSSSEVTACSSWAAIDSFVNHELGKQCMAAQSYDEAFQYFMALMSDDKIPPKLQNKYLQELLQLFLESDDQAALQSTEEGSRRSASVQLSIPDIDPHMARIIMSPELEGDDGMLEWRLDGSTPVSSSADSSAAARSLQQNGHKCCAVGETVAVLLVVTNPLTIGVTLNSFTLDCEFAAAGEQDGDVAAFEVSTVPSVILEGGQTSMVTVEIVARQTGELSIAGAKFLLCDILPTYKSLRLPGRRLNDTKEQRMALAYSPETSLGFRVDPELPHLHVAMHDFPDTLMSGSVHKAAIHIVNQGSLACRGMVLWLSHPSFFDIKSPHLLSDEATNAALSDVYQRQAAVSETETLSVNNALQDCSEFLLVGDARQQLAGARHLVPVESLAPGETLVVPLWARGDRVGDHSLRLSIGSCADAAALQAGVSRVMRSRTFDVDLLVTPSLRVNAFVRPSTRSPQERLLGIEVENMQADMSVQLIQTTFSSGHYRLEPIFIAEQKAVPGGQVVIGPRQTVNLMYRARPYRANKQGGGVLEKSSPAQTAVPEWFAINALRKYIYSNEKPKQLPEPIELIYSNAVLGDHEGIDCVHSSLQNYIVRSQSHRRRNMLRANYPMIPERFHHVLFPLFETFGIDFVLFWAEIGGAARSGHHSITGIDLGVPHDYINEALNPPEEGAARAWLANTVNEREALIHSIANRASAMANRHERTIDVAMRVLSVSRGIRDTGDEASSIMSIADVGITVRNHSWRYGYKVRLDLFSPADLGQLMTDKIRLDYSGSRSSWSWLEKPNFLIVVGPQGSVEVGAKLACLTSGVVDIGLWKLRAVALEPSKDGAVSIESAAAKAQYSSKNLECTIYPVLPYFVSIDTLE
ncbi:hypothetical protein LPJ56_002231 [Coemansia sp. RSA 2599]|nr:hypothetical protein LPJ56_002231 [Coemansia sp. RSA 2599]